ncbi:hypothetical protein [Palleronia abyssalis]|uniref:UDP-N-acetylglucosamine--N-acetylmuramyl-(Pentapeptide) pyrophosphoryl-undecaprenol N-acetylglucosamine transferase n=1 Tax=Palleronia abyssalis TaxID=1501240 RepID=A0A2R8BXK6_9RHOB|nr:hypothetical protein [Palleronia abyssalis]SPJ24852.1 UDP-N-acetylglucosamine--N-acetylmuramyl-(pentapeptide) pyrophosphoryl-undecaprenol N-acetylglucosamine transferase [Palleronia abyssalis]
MRDTVETTQPIGYFVHHQGRGHAERCAAIAHALPPSRPLTIFCAKPDIFPDLPRHAQIVQIPSLFEPVPGQGTLMDDLPTPRTLHCAPVGWPGIREATGRMASWFAEVNPALMICDVSAEIAQFSRICSVPHVKVLQHGDRRDEGHVAAYDGAAGLLAPFDRVLAQPDWPEAMVAKTCFAGGLGVDTGLPDKATARAMLGLDPERRIVLAMSGGGGSGLAQAPLGVGARTFPDAQWISIGPVQRDWHATEPGNLEHRGWVNTAAAHIAAADLVVAAPGNTACQMILAAGVPWIAVPEWRYFDEQVEKARALARAGVALHLPHPPSSAHAWREAVDLALASHDPARQRALVVPDAAARTADWLEGLIATLWHTPVLNHEVPA